MIGVRRQRRFARNKLEGDPMSKRTKNEQASNSKPSAQPFQMPAVPEGFKLIAMYKPIWRERLGSRVAGYPIGIQPEQKADGSRFTAIMCRLTASAEVQCTDHEGSRDFEAREGDIIAIDGSEPCMEKLVALAAGDEVYKIELWIVPTKVGAKKMLLVEKTPTSRSKVDPVVIAAEKYAAEVAGNNGASSG
jgi:hypothetical protein